MDILLLLTSLPVWIWTEFRSESGTYFCWGLSIHWRVDRTFI